MPAEFWFFLSGSAGHLPVHIFVGRVTEEGLLLEEGEKGVILIAHSWDINFIIDCAFTKNKLRLNYFTINRESYTFI